ncbi:Adhesin-like protein [Phytophthora palmivora]|uniref:Adhesin-like protein n=1 Tax=Phytophthora palmivora TaxID=4796 RepID=A0A2P4YTN4_9STRA|nr:Adhesin-like protein [Phytophthora palmivora]
MSSDAQGSADSGLGFSIPLTAIHGSRNVGVKRNGDLDRESPSKKRVLTPPPSNDDVDSASPRTDVSWPSDEEPHELLLVNCQQKTPTVKKRSNAAFSTEGMSPEAVKQHKAQRRREQVRAASRRCRDRQRKETEDLRTKVFQLEEFIAHTMQSHEWEKRQQNERIQALQHENDVLTQQLAAATAARVDDIEPVPLGTPVKLEDSALPEDLVDCIGSDDVLCQWSEELVYHAVEDTTRQLVMMLESQVEPVKSPIIFGWQFDFWCEGDKYFGRNRKFFPGVTALELAKRMQMVDPQRYMETFPEVKKMEVLQVFDENVLVMRLVKALPGKTFTQAVNARFMATAAPPTGSTSRWVYADRTIDEPIDGEYALENECNGYVFEDTIQELPDGTRIEGCLAQGVGQFESGGLECSVLLEELAQAFSSVVIRWESLFINDFILDDADDFADMVLDL